jgi:exonuclease VII large subunit
VLGRGYAFVQAKNGEIISSSLQLKVHDSVNVTLHVGSFDAIIESTKP